MILVSGCSETTNKGGDYYDDVDVVMAVMVVIIWFLIVQVGKIFTSKNKTDNGEVLFTKTVEGVEDHHGGSGLCRDMLMEIEKSTLMKIGLLRLLFWMLKS